MGSRSCAWVWGCPCSGLFQGDPTGGIWGLHGMPSQGFIQLDRRSLTEPGLGIQYGLHKLATPHRSRSGPRSINCCISAWRTSFQVGPAASLLLHQRFFDDKLWLDHRLLSNPDRTFKRIWEFERHHHMDLYCNGSITRYMVHAVACPPDG